ncbi:hypothetical protein [Halorarum salinum]|uniref:hypothetical protein n=1 Tax=Halorarum salinum TaxID=2743089 RepID=UPI001FE3F38E|nr:hypothetical protein [Halobaculum salinum]
MFVILLVTVSSVAIGLTAATDPVGSNTAAPPLDDNETATLWSKDADTCDESIVNVSRATSETSAIQELANCTDITFKRPPRTAATWSEHDFESLEAGGENTSVHPPDANLTDSWAIADAHASVFAVHPSTRVHRGPSETPLFIAPSGTVRGFVDYRIRSFDNGTDSWTVTDHEVREVRLYQGSEVLAISDGSQTPALEYDTSVTESTSLTFEADIRVTLTRADRTGTGDGTRTETTVDEVTVSDTILIQVYEPAVERYSARYPNGDVGLAVYQTQPWHGYSLTESGEARIRGVWRYYTARDTAWDTLIHSTTEGSDRVPSPVRPVYVHAYPSEIGPRAEPVRDGPTILDVWGVESQSPASELHENVSVEVIEQPYVHSSGLALRTSERISIDSKCRESCEALIAASASLTGEPAHSAKVTSVSRWRTTTDRAQPFESN